MAFSDLELYFSFISSIDIISDYEFIGIMEAPMDYQIVEVHASNMIKLTTRMGRYNDKLPLPPPSEVQIR